MPRRLDTPCQFPGCPGTSRGRYCHEHDQRRLPASDARRGTPTQRGYDRAWEKVAKQRRQIDCYLCQPCLAQDHTTASNVVDHIVPIHVRPDWRLEIGNTQVICATCHARKSHEDTKCYGSSTATRLTAEQIENRRRAQELATTSR